MRIHKMSDALRHTLRNEQNCNVLPELSKLEESLFHFCLSAATPGSQVADVKICALATGTLPNSWGKSQEVEECG
jgi:hypothetical protein